MALRLVPFGRPALQVLRQVVAEAKAGDLLAPVSIAVPSNYAGLSLRRTLGTKDFTVLAGRQGLLNVRFLALPRLAELLGAPALAAQGRRPLTTPLRAEAIRAVLAADPGPLEPVRDHPTTGRSLEATFQELRQASPEALETLGSQSPRARHVVRLFRAFRAATRDYYDHEDVTVAAAYAARARAPALRDVGHVVLFLPRHLSAAELDLAAALAEVGKVTGILGLTGDPEADEPSWRLAEPLARALGAVEEIPRPAVAAGTHVVAAPDAEEEVRLALRLAMQRLAAGTPLYRMALLYPAPQPYALLAHQLLAGAQVPHNGSGVHTLAQTLAGRTLLGLLRLREADFRRDILMDWLTAGPVLEQAGGSPVPGQRWDALSRSAGVVRGIAQWQDRLTRFAGTMREEQRVAAATEEASQARLRRLEVDQDHAERLDRFIADLAASLDPGPRTTWPELAGWASGLLLRYLGGEGHRRAWPDTEIEAFQRVEHALQALSALHEVRQRTDERTFRRALERELEAPAGRIGRFGEGMFVGRIADAVGTDFDVLFVVGMAEGLIPPLGREDPLVPDREREASGATIPLRGGRVAEARRDYLAALAAAPERVLLFPRADVRGQRGKLPSRWLLETASALEDRPLFSADLEALPARPWLTSVPSFEAALARAADPASEQEYDLRSLLLWRRAGREVHAHYLVGARPALRNGLGCQAERASAAFSRCDGRVAEAKTVRSGGVRSVSPTSLQVWAECPFAYFLGYVLRVTENERPEDVLSISPLDRGNLVHEALETFIREMPERASPSQPWSPAERAHLAALGKRLCDQYESAGRTGKRLLWLLERERIGRDLLSLLDADEALRIAKGVVPKAVELSFGLEQTGQPPVAVRLESGQVLAFRGRIDRVDLSPDGSRVVVLDYKTGSARAAYRQLDKDPLAAGRLLQLPVYALAAGQQFGTAEVEAYYWFVTEQGGCPTFGYRVDEARLNAFRATLEVIAEGIKAGLFPARPGAYSQGSFEHCRYCPYDPCCPADRGRAWQRKRSAPELERYLALVGE